MSIPVIYGSVREKRQGIKAAKYITKQLKKRGMNPILIDPIEYDLPLLKKKYSEYEEGEAPEIIEKLGKIMKEAEGFVIVTGEYNHSIPPALKNILDHYLEEYFFKPVGIVCYSAGAFGGVRAAVHLRVIVSELGMVSISTKLPIPKVQDAFDEEGNAKDNSHDKKTKKFLDEFEWYLEALNNQKNNKGKPF